jgi:hypothetical protein
VRKWRDVSAAEIEEIHPEGVYNSFDINQRETIPWDELANMPVLDRARNEIPLYTERGFLLPRRLPVFSRNTPAHGILMDLRSVKDLFEAPFEQQELHPDAEEPVDTYTYPQAGLKIAGHFQANGLMKDFVPFMHEVNQDLNALRTDDDGMNYTPPAHQHVVRGIACQGYNAVMHSTRGDSAQHHDAQLGMITGALAGSWAKVSSSENTASKLRDRCSRQLPHASFNEKIQNEKILRDLRLENVYYIDVQAIDETHQNGL